jgi:hypothetical protein
VLKESPSNIAPDKQEKLYRAVNLGPLIEKPSDYLGHHVCEKRGSGWNSLAFFPTPHNICELMVRMSMENGDADLRCASVMDPCVGSGRMLLHASNLSMNLFGQDVDPMMCLICKLNGVLYAPWLTFPLHEEIVGQTKMAPPPASLPVRDPPPEEIAIYRVDDRGQGLLF